MAQTTVGYQAPNTRNRHPLGFPDGLGDPLDFEECEDFAGDDGEVTRLIERNGMIGVDFGLAELA